MQISQRLRQIIGDGDDGWGLHSRARAMVKAGQPVIELTIGEHDIRTDPRILNAMHKAAVGGHTGYASTPGVAGLRTTVADRMTRRTGVPTTAANILIVPGGQAALFAAHYAVLNPGDTALYIDPYYATYPGTIRAAGGVPIAVAALPEDGFLPRPAALHHTGARSLLINTPNNPTGAVYPAHTLQGIAAACQAQDLWLISDEVYDTQVWRGPHISPRGLPGMAKRTLVIGSMSKSHAMTGSRIGWICAPEAVITHLADLALNTTYGVPGYIQDAALFALSEGAALEEDIAAPFRRRRDLTMALLAQQTILHAIPPDGAMYVMLDVRGTGLDGAAFAEALLDAEKISVMPGASFGKAAAGHIRIAMTVDDESYVAAMKRVIAFAQKCASQALIS